MSLTYTIDVTGVASGGGLSAVTSHTLSTLTGDFINIIASFGDNTDATAWTISNDGTAVTWTQQQETNTASNCKVVHWTGTVGATPLTTVTVTVTAGAFTTGSKALVTIVHNGQHATTPLPAGNLFLLSSGTGKTQSITPTSTGSTLWLIVGDWGATNTYGAGTNNTMITTGGLNVNASAVSPYHEAGFQTVVAMRPTTQPRTDALAFTLSETDIGGTIIGVAFEVQAAAAAGSSPPMFRGH